eukprot:m.37143 g.37143  ORF g.37143 m.37143 type:complete len:92 (-) comp6723_c0_seq2:72-347(-)
MFQIQKRKLFKRNEGMSAFHIFILTNMHSPKGMGYSNMTVRMFSICFVCNIRILCATLSYDPPPHRLYINHKEHLRIRGEKQMMTANDEMG